jgi:hypothetical protein
MDGVTQSNASGAEESASAAEELNSQALTLKECVNQLLVIVNGRGAGLLPVTPVIAAPSSRRVVLPAAPAKPAAPVSDDFFAPTRTAKHVSP